MQTDIYGQQILNEVDLCELYLQDPDRVVRQALVEKEINFKDLALDNIPEVLLYKDPKL